MGGEEMSSLTILPDPLLIEAYEKAINIELDSSFINILLNELQRRGIEVVEEEGISIMKIQ